MYAIVEVDGNECKVLDTSDGVVDVFSTQDLVDYTERYNLDIKGINKITNKIESVAYNFYNFALDFDLAKYHIFKVLVRVNVAKFLLLNQDYEILSSLNSYITVLVSKSKSTVLLVTPLDSIIAYKSMRCMFASLDIRHSCFTMIDLSNFNTCLVTDMSSMFSNCGSLEKLSLGDFDTRNVKDMSYMFFKCEDLGSINTEKLDTCNVKDMSYMFFDCMSLGSICTEKFDTSSVLNVERMFCLCRKIKYLDLSNFNMNKVEIIRDMFLGCNSLVALNIRNFPDTAKKVLDGVPGDCTIAYNGFKGTVKQFEDSDKFTT